MTLDISKALRNPGEYFPFDLSVSIPAQDILGDTVTFDDPVQMSGTMCLTEGRLRLKGTLTATARAECAKCLAPAAHPVQVRFDEIFTRQGEKREDEQEELDDEDRLAYDGPQLAVDQLAMTLAVLDLPIRFLCREDCEGIHLPQTDPEHAAEKEVPAAHPFSALQQLLNKDQEV